MQQIHAANPEVIFTGTYGPDALLQFREITELGNKAPWFLLYPETADFSKLPNSDNRAFGAEPGWLEDKAADWSNRYKQATGEDAGLFSAQGYDNTMLAALAVANASGHTADDLKQSYRTVAQTYTGPTGKYEFNDQFSRINAPLKWSYAKGGKFIPWTP